MTATDDSLSALMIELRPRLHRYCARMVGSVFEGEDVVQETLTKATEALASGSPVANIERWLFAIAHNTSLDALRRRKRQAEVPFNEESADEADSNSQIESWITTDASLAAIMQLPVIQRSAVILVDVLDYSVEETVHILDSTLPAVKAALHRGRTRLKHWSDVRQTERVTVPAEDISRLRAYADSFNARDFDTLRNLLAEDVKLDLVNRLRLTGRKDVSVYFGRYGERDDWKFSIGLAEDRLALFVSDLHDPTDTPTYVVLLDWRDGKIVNIQDFRWAPYVTNGLAYMTL
ncbi:MAG TPA: sigma-70 family RNA polymerase sigma factor [Steroidobacteraceae bacterium]|nr:sigma-70 family RNA polymerase sigma factor [Steroidobacteraceae bacterium]